MNIGVLIGGGNMFRRKEKEKELREQLIRVEEQRNYWMNQYSWISEEITSIIRANGELKVNIQKLKKELEEQKQITAKHISMYYDIVQKLKNVMEETGYGKDL